MAVQDQERQELHVVNPDPKYARAELVEPTTHGYIYIGAAIRPGRLPLVLPNRERMRLQSTLKELARQLARTDAVIQATVFRAIVKPPTTRFSAYLKELGASLHAANFDVMVLIETTSVATIDAARATPQYQALLEAIRHSATYVYVMAAHNIRRIGDVDTTRKGVFLFNHFAAANPAIMPELWEVLAGWYAVETGLDNSVALAPLPDEPADYALVNWARWDAHPLVLIWRQLSTKSFRTYVTANLDANHAGSMPILCRLA